MKQASTAPYQLLTGKWCRSLPFGNLCYVHVLVDTYSSFTYAIAVSGEKASLMIKALKSAMMVMECPGP